MTTKLLRGGSWFNEPLNCRAASRDRNHPDFVVTSISLRVVCLPLPQPSNDN